MATLMSGGGQFGFDFNEPNADTQCICIITHWFAWVDQDTL